jgi:hypothetical protein
MATTTSAPDLAQSQQAQPPATADLILSLPTLSQEALAQTLDSIAQAFAGQSVLVATPDAASSAGAVPIVNYAPTSPSGGSFTLVAADFLNAYSQLSQHQARAVLVLGAEVQTLAPTALRALADAVLTQGVDLAVARYTLPARAGLVNSAILYPMSRALFGAPPRFPLGLDLGLSARMAEKLASIAQRFTAANQPDAILWPVAEAAVSSSVISEINAGPRTFPQPSGNSDLNSVLAHITGSLFADIDQKAAYWQRARVAPHNLAPAQTLPASAPPEDVKPMLDAFRLAYTNLREIWSLVLPPQSLVGLKRLSVTPADSFSMPDSLWARVVYDFLLAFRLRTINRGHLLGALTPLYLAWVASHILLTASGTDPERHIESVAAAFEADKPYLVSRWRWPDRFNP